MLAREEDDMGFCALGRSFSCWERGRRLPLLLPLLLLLLEMESASLEAALSCWVGRRPLSDVSSLRVVRMLRVVVEAKGRRGLVLMAAARNCWVAEVTEVRARDGEGKACRKAVVAPVARRRTRVQERTRVCVDVAVACCMVLDGVWATGGVRRGRGGKNSLRMVLLWTILWVWGGVGWCEG